LNINCTVRRSTVRPQSPTENVVFVEFPSAYLTENITFVQFPSSPLPVVVQAMRTVFQLCLT
jgi:hypothetical protein